MDTKINYDTTLMDSITGECIEVEKGSKIISPQRQEQMKEYAQKAARTSKVKNELYKDTNRLRGDFILSFAEMLIYCGMIYQNLLWVS